MSVRSQPESTTLFAADTRPFFFPAGPVGCLLLHGFTGTPYEMRFMGERLFTSGYSVNGVQLAGHCTSVEDLEWRTWQDWYSSARAGLAELRHGRTHIVLIGQSMGALLALKLAVDDPDAVIGVVLLSPALMLSNPWLHRLGPAFPYLLPFLSRRRRYVGKGESDIADPHARAASPNYRRVPLRALHQLLLLQKQVRRILPHVRRQVLVVHSRQDHTCPLSNVELLQQALGNPPRTRVLDASYHVVSVDVEKEQIALEVQAFIAEIPLTLPWP